jgi:hypothetical protein
MDIQHLLEIYDLPELPDETDYIGPDQVELVLFVQYGDNVPLAYVSHDDAMEYANREDTHGNGWFVGFRTV